MTATGKTYYHLVHCLFNEFIINNLRCVNENGNRYAFKQKKAPKSIKTQGLFFKRIRRRPTLPHSYPCSTIGAEELNFRVRDGNGCDLFAITTE